MKIVRIVFISLLIFVVTVLALAITLPYVFKDELLEYVKSEMDKQLKVRPNFQDVSISIFSSFPDLRFSLLGLTMVGQDEFEGDTLVSIGEFSLDFRLTSLIEDKIKVSAIRLLDPHIYLQTSSRGEVNWDIVKVDSNAIKETNITLQENAPIAEAPSDSVAPLSIGIDLFEIRDAYLTYDDKKGKMKAQISDFDFELRGTLSQSISDLSLKSSIQNIYLVGNESVYANKLRLSWKAKIAADLTKQLFTIKENSLVLNKLVLQLIGKIGPLDPHPLLNVSFKLGNSSQLTDLLSLLPEEYYALVADYQSSGEFTLSGYANGAYKSANNLPALNVMLNIHKAKLQYPDLPSAIDDIEVDMSIDLPGGNPDNTKVLLRKFVASVAGSTIETSLSVVHPISDPEIDATMSIDANLSSVKKAIKLPDNVFLSGFVKGKAELKTNLSYVTNEQFHLVQAGGQLIVKEINVNSQDVPTGKVNIPMGIFQFTTNSAAIRQLDINIGQSDLHFTGLADNILGYVFDTLGGETIVLNGKLTSNYFDVNPFLAPDEAQTENTSSQSEEKEVSSPQDTMTLEYIELPGNIDGKFQASFKNLHYDQMNITNLRGDVAVRKKTVYFTGLSFNALKGYISMSGRFEAPGKIPPRFFYRLNVSNIDIQEMTKSFTSISEMAPIMKSAYGQVSLGTDIRGLLQKDMTLQQKSLNGVVSLSTSTLQIKDNKLFSKIADATKNDLWRSPSISPLKARVEVVNGALHIRPPVKATISGQPVEFAGSQSLDMQMNYTLSTKTDVTPLTQNLGDVSSFLKGVDLKNFPLGMNITGTVTKPKVGIDTKGMTAEIKRQGKKAVNQELQAVKKKAEDELKKRLEKEKKKATDELKKKAQDKLKDLFR